MPEPVDPSDVSKGVCDLLFDAAPPWWVSAVRSPFVPYDGHDLCRFASCPIRSGPFSSAMPGACGVPVERRPSACTTCCAGCFPTGLLQCFEVPSRAGRGSASAVLRSLRWCRSYARACETSLWQCIGRSRGRFSSGCVAAWLSERAAAAPNTKSVAEQTKMLVQRCRGVWRGIVKTCGRRSFT